MKWVAELLEKAAQRLNAWLYARRLDKLLRGAGPSRFEVILSAVAVVVNFWLIGLLVFVASFGLHLLYNSDVPLNVGGNIIALLALFFSMFVNAEAGFIDWLEAFTRRLATPNERARASAGYTEVHRLICKWRTTGAIFRNTVTISNIFLFLAGLALPLL